MAKAHCTSHPQPHWTVRHALSVLSAALFAQAPSYGHNDHAFVAAAMPEVRVDGDLSDWPESDSYPISTVYMFDGHPDTPDFTGRFRVGCNYEGNALFVAVEVEDDTFVFDAPDDIWSSRDACEIFLVADHDTQFRVPLQFVYRDKPAIANGWASDADPSDTFMVSRRANGSRVTYEWRIALNFLQEQHLSLKKGAIFGFDVAYVDRDSATDLSVLSSSPGGAKHKSSLEHGDLVIPPEGGSMGRVRGRVQIIPPRPNQDYPPVALQSSDASRIFRQVECDDLGFYEAILPTGAYAVSPVDSISLRVSDDHQVHFTVDSSGKTVPPQLPLRTLDPPDIIPERGMLWQDTFDEAGLDEFVRSYMSYYRIPGLSLAVVKDGRVIYSKGHGVKDRTTMRPVADTTIFETASMTKPVFAYAICRLVERGVIDLDKPLYEYLPNDDLADDERYKLITARLVLCHRTGLPNWREGPLTIGFTPGTGQSYSGEAYGYLAAVASHLTGKSIEELMQDEVFEPLGIENTHLTWTALADEEITALPHSRKNSPIVKSQWSEPWVAGCLQTDAGNFAKFIAAVIDVRGLSKSMHEEMLRPQANLPEDSDDQNFGLGFVVGTSPFGTYYGHGGQNRGFTSAFEILKEARCGYVFMVNNYQGPLLHDALKAYLVTGRDRPSKANGSAL